MAVMAMRTEETAVAVPEGVATARASSSPSCSSPTRGSSPPHTPYDRARGLAAPEPDRAAEIDEISAEEIDHRARVRAMLDALDVAPDAGRERRLLRIGRTISAFCRVGGWFGPMYGAARLERKNIGEYERAAGYAITAGHPELIEDLVDMSEVEWDHERWFRERLRGPLAVAGVPEVAGPASEGQDPDAGRALDAADAMTEPDDRDRRRAGDPPRRADGARPASTCVGG